MLLNFENKLLTPAYQFSIIAIWVYFSGSSSDSDLIYSESIESISWLCRLNALKQYANERCICIFLEENIQCLLWFMKVSMTHYFVDKVFTVVLKFLLCKL